MVKLRDIDDNIFYGDNHGGVFAVWDGKDKEKAKNIANYGSAYVAQEKGQYTFIDETGKEFKIPEPEAEEAKAEGGIKQDTVPENTAATHPANRLSVEKGGPPPVVAPGATPQTGDGTPGRGEVSQTGEEGSGDPDAAKTAGEAGSDAPPAPKDPVTP